MTALGVFETLLSKPWSLVKSKTSGFLKYIKLIARVYSYSRKFLSLVIINNFFTAMTAISGLLIPKYSGDVIDIVSRKDRSGLFDLIQAMTFVYLFNSIGWIVRN